MTGAVEPTDSDCEWESSDEEEEDTDEKVNTLAVSTGSGLQPSTLALHPVLRRLLLHILA